MSGSAPASDALAPLIELVRWVLLPRNLALAAMVALLVLSALSTADASRQSRALFAELEALRIEQDLLLEQRGRLLLERSAFSAYNRVEAVAVDELGMRMPLPIETRLVQP